MSGLVVAAAVAVAVGAAGAPGIEAPAHPAPAHRPAQVRSHKSAAKAGATAIKISRTPAGAVLANAGGHVLFTFTKDRRNKDRCNPSKNCRTDWPPVTTTGKPIAGPGVRKSLLGTIPYRGEQREVTYGGHPLHTYKFDDGAAVSFTFIGIKQFGGAWYALTAADKVVKNPGG